MTSVRLIGQIHLILYQTIRRRKGYCYMIKVLSLRLGTERNLKKHAIRKEGRSQQKPIFQERQFPIIPFVQSQVEVHPPGRSQAKTGHP